MVIAIQKMNIYIVTLSKLTMFPLKMNYYAGYIALRVVRCRIITVPLSLDNFKSIEYNIFNG